MIITVPGELYQRFAEIPKLLLADHPDQYLRSIYFERKNSQLFCVATCAKIAAIEYLGPNTGPDEHCAIKIDQALLDQIEKEITFNCMLHIASNEVFKFTSIKTGLGFTSANLFVELPTEPQFVNWRTWLPEHIPTENNCVMYWFCNYIYALACSSPSGGLVFPQYFDDRQPVLITDSDKSNWIGLFMLAKEKQNVPAIPDWV